MKCHLVLSKYSIFILFAACDMQGESWEGCSEPNERSHTHLSICHMKTQHCVFSGCCKWNGSLEGLRNDWFCMCGMVNYGIQSLSCSVILWSLDLIPSNNISMLDGICMQQGDASSDIALWRSKILSSHFSFTEFTSPGEISLSHPVQYVEKWQTDIYNQSDVNLPGSTFSAPATSLIIVAINYFWMHLQGELRSRFVLVIRLDLWPLEMRDMTQWAFQGVKS